MSIVYYLMNEYVRKYRLKPIGPHRALANSLMSNANSPKAIEGARTKVLEQFPDAGVEIDKAQARRFMPRASVRNLRKPR